MQTKEFNLVYHSWIRVLYTDGTHAILSLKQVFEQWENIYAVNGRNTKATYCIQRMLALITAKVCGGWTTTASYEQVMNDGSLGEQIVSYLKATSHLFTIGDPQRPFLQNPTLNGMVDEAALDSLRLSDITKTDGILGYPHTLLHPPSFSGPDLAEFLLVESMLSGMGLCGGPIKAKVQAKGFKPEKTYSASAAVAQGKTHVVPRANTLRETLLLSIPPEIVPNTALLAWERERELMPANVTPNTSFELSNVLTRSTLLFWNEYGEVRCVFTGVGDKLSSAYLETLPQTKLVHTAPTRKATKTGDRYFAAPQKLQPSWADLKNFFIVGHEAADSGFIRAPIVDWVSRLSRENLLPETLTWEVTQIIKAGKTQPTISACLIEEIQIPSNVFDESSESGLALFDLFKFISEVDRNFFTCNSQQTQEETGDKKISPLGLIRKYRDMFPKDITGALKMRTAYPLSAQFLPLAKQVFDRALLKVSQEPAWEYEQWEVWFAHRKQEILTIANTLWKQMIFCIPLTSPSIVMAVGKSTAQINRLNYLYSKEIKEILNETN